MTVNSNLAALADELRVQADRVNRMAKELCLPVQDCTLNEAFARIRAVVSNETLITIDVVLQQYSTDKKVEARWSVYDGASKMSFEAYSLADAVNQCVAAHAPEPKDSLEKVSEKLYEAVALPL